MRNKGIALHSMALLAGGLIATGAMAQTQMASAVPEANYLISVPTEIAADFRLGSLKQLVPRVEDHQPVLRARR